MSSPIVYVNVRLGFAVAACCLFLSICQPAAAQELIISEFQARNSGVILDENGDESDWIEVHSLETFAVDLDGWFLTDDPTFLSKWRFPAVTLPGGGFLIVFASDKDRRDPENELHLNFQLSGAGEYLALVRPDGITIAHEYAPEFPRQPEGFSYGIAQAQETVRFVAAGDAAAVRIPASGADGLSWTLPGFNDGGWIGGLNGVGFDLEEGGGGGGDPENVAPLGTASQSSTLGGFSASLALDSNFENFTHTTSGQSPASWEVDLQDSYPIERIVLWNRTSCCGSRLRDITVSVLDASRTTVFQSPLLNPENALAGGQLGPGPASLDIDLIELSGSLATGRYVRVVRTPDPDLSGSGGGGNADEAEVLQLAEVEVFQRPIISYQSLIQTDVEAEMEGINASAYVRLPFDLAEVSPLDVLRLRVQYDDGFVAYLNGVEVARRNAPGTPAWNSQATAEVDDLDAFVFEEILITEHQDALQVGGNVLAIHGLNLGPSDPDFLVVAELDGATLVASAEVYFEDPTPGAINDPSGVVGFVSDTTFSHDRGFYEDPINVEITSETPGASIRYTLNGDEPSPTSGTVYTGPIFIDRTTVLRAIAYMSGLEPTNVDSQTYIYLEDVILQDHAATRAAGFPSSWDGTSPDYGMDFTVIGQNGSDNYGGRYAATIRDDLMAVPTISIVMDIDDMFGSNGIYSHPGSRGVAWERPCSMEVIYPDGRAGTQVNCGIRIQGGAFRSHGLTRKKSLRLLFKEIYGSTKLRFPLFGPDASDRIDTFTLRAVNNDGWQWSGAGDKPLYIRDSFGRENVLDMGGVASHEIFAFVYINGFFWGLYNPVERPDHSFSATYFGGEKEDWDSVSNGSASNGSLSAWNSLLSLGDGGAFATLATYMRSQGLNPDGSRNPAYPVLVDVDNVADYMISNFYGGNSDWPGKNYWYGRDRTAASTGFKYYMWDSEWSLDLRSNLSTDRSGVSNGVAEPYGDLRASPEFRLRFGDRVHRHFFNGGAFYVDPANQSWDPAHPERNQPAARFVRLANLVDRAVVAESARWGDQHTDPAYTRDEHWERERDDLLQNYFPTRSARVLQHFRARGLYPGVDAPLFNLRGGRVEPGFTAVLVSSSGTTYYTLDGNDPRELGGDVSPSAFEAGSATTAVFIDQGDTAAVLVPTSGTLGLSWIEPEFNDSSWRRGPTGVGYETTSGYEPEIGTDIEAEASGENPTVYVRQEFQVDDPTNYTFVTLRMKYDDGFVAYLNGELVAQSGAPGTLSWNTAATGSRPDEDAVVFQSFDLAGGADLLQTGTNVLAIHGLNSSSGSSDFLIVPALVASDVQAGGFVIDEPVVVKTRAFSAGEWSALDEAFFYFDIPLRISEIMYHPRDPAVGTSGFPADEFEFVELVNVGTEPIDLDGFRLVGAVQFDFTDGFHTVAPGETILVVRNLAAFIERYPFLGATIAGEYSGNFSNAGEGIILLGPADEPILDFEYRQEWQPETDGQGFSLAIVDPLAEPESWGLEESWTASADFDGTPGVVDGGLPTGGLQWAGDWNQDGAVDIADAVALLFQLFDGDGRPLPCDGDFSSGGNLELADVNGDASVNLTDILHLANYLFASGAAPALGESCTRIEGCPNACF